MQLNLNLSSRNVKAITIDETSQWEFLSEQLDVLPNPGKEVLPGIKWGYCSQLFTPAYWKVQYLMYNKGDTFDIKYSLGSDILEEVVACLLGGFGLKSEIGLAAFYRLRNRGYIRCEIDFLSINQSLKEPFELDGKKVHYRFPNQKAKFITEFLNRKDLESIPLDCDITLRNWLTTIKGIGPKTASWITRNFLDSENVAIIDIHIFRACLVMGLYTENDNVQRDYIKLEQIFLYFCKKLEVQPSKLDALMWLQMKESGSTAIKIYNNHKGK
jgi:thermostable 8-oxoguanine DNA glycosylase